MYHDGGATNMTLVTRSTGSLFTFSGDGLRVRYPFGESTWLGKYIAFDWFIKKSLLGASADEYADFAIGSGQLIRQNKLTKDTSKIINWNFERDTAYHIDAALLGKYLKISYI